MKVVNFKYVFQKWDKQEEEIIFPVSIPFKNEVNEVAHKIISEKINPIMIHFNTHKELQSVLREFIKEQNQIYYDELDEDLLHRTRAPEIDVDVVIRDKEKLYKEETIEFADRVGSHYCWSDKEIFAQSFHRLVHSSSLTSLLTKEKNHAKIIKDMNDRMDDELNQLASSQQVEMEQHISELDVSRSSDDINNLLSRHYNALSFTRQKWESEIEAKRGHLYILYRNWITSEISENIMLDSPTSTPTVGNRSSMFITQTPALEESFTIHLGSQLKHMHNIRILSADVEDLCSPLHEDESLNGLNIALGLYSSSLCGVVVLTEPGNVIANSKIVKNANLSTDFHFESVNNQIEHIQTDLREQLSDEVAAKLKPGDFFITKHSNLSQTHIIFHLISDENFHSPRDINSRHPVILGMRNILKTASRHDITTITIPALLRHEMSEGMTVSWCVRRAELIFKCAKGFMIESASWGGAEISTLQLLLPKNISEDLFTTLASMVPNVFRVANPKVFQENSSETLLTNL